MTVTLIEYSYTKYRTEGHLPFWVFGVHFPTGCRVTTEVDASLFMPLRPPSLGDERLGKDVL